MTGLDPEDPIDAIRAKVKASIRASIVDSIRRSRIPPAKPIWQFAKEEGLQLPPLGTGAEQVQQATIASQEGMHPVRALGEMARAGVVEAADVGAVSLPRALKRFTGEQLEYFGRAAQTEGVPLEWMIPDSLARWAQGLGRETRTEAEHMTAENIAAEIEARSARALRGESPLTVTPEQIAEQRAGHEAAQREIVEDYGFAGQLGLGVAKAAGGFAGFMAGAPGKIISQIQAPISVVGHNLIGKSAMNTATRLGWDAARMAREQAAGTFFESLAKEAAGSERIKAAFLKMGEKWGIDTLANMVGFGAQELALTDASDRIAAAGTAALTAPLYLLAGRLGQAAEGKIYQWLHGRVPYDREIAAMAGGLIEGTGFAHTDWEVMKDGVRGAYLLSQPEAEKQSEGWRLLEDYATTVLSSAIGIGLVRGVKPSEFPEWMRRNPDAGRVAWPVFRERFQEQLGKDVEGLEWRFQLGPRPADQTAKEITDLSSDLVRLGWEGTAAADKGWHVSTLPGFSGRVFARSVDGGEHEIRLDATLGRVLGVEPGKVFRGTEAADLLYRLKMETLASNATSRVLLSKFASEAAGGVFDAYDGKQYAFRFGELYQRAAPDAPWVVAFGRIADAVKADLRRRIGEQDRFALRDPVVSEAMSALADTIDSMKIGTMEIAENPRVRVALDTLDRLTDHLAMADAENFKSDIGLRNFVRLWHDPAFLDQVETKEWSPMTVEAFAENMAQVLAGAQQRPRWPMPKREKKAAVEEAKVPAEVPGEIEQAGKMPEETKVALPSQVETSTEVKALAEAPAETSAIMAAPQQTGSTHQQRPRQMEPVTKKRISPITLRREMEKAIGGTPMRAGRAFMEGGPGTLGYLETRQDLIRISGANELNTMAHEFGHGLHMKALDAVGHGEKLDIKFAQLHPDPNIGDRIDVELDRLGRELYGSNVPAQGHYRAEGFAEFIARKLWRDPRLAEIAPEASKWIPEFLKAKGLLKGLERVEAGFKTWIEQGAAGRIEGMIGEPKRQIGESIAAFAKRSEERWIDQFAPIKEMVQAAAAQMGHGEAEAWLTKIAPNDNPYMTLLALNGAAPGTARFFIEHSAVDTAMNRVGPSLNAAFKPIKNEEMREFVVYWIARRAQDYHTKGLKSGFSSEDVNFFVRNVDPAKKERFEKAVREITDWSSLVLQYLEKSGGMPMGTTDQIEAETEVYAPFHRVFEDAIRRRAQGVTAGQGYVNLGQPVKFRTGSGRSIRHPVEALIEQTQRTISRAHKARVSRALLNLIQKYPGLGRYASIVPQGSDKPDANVVTVRRPTGEEVQIQLRPDMMRALTNMDYGFIDGMVSYMASMPARMVRLGATGLSPHFTVHEFIRDLYGAAAYGRWGHLPRAFIEGIRLIRNWMSDSNAMGKTMLAHRDAIHDIYKASGAVLSQRIGQSAVWHRVKTAGRITPLQSVRAIIEAAERILASPESALRITEFRARYDEALKKFNGDKEQALIYALAHSKELLINFTRFGSMMRSVNQIAPFSNSMIRASDKFIRTAVGAEGRPAMARLFTAGVLGITVPAMLNWLMNKDKDWYQQLDKHERSRWLLVFNFGTDEKPELKGIPMPHELGWIFGFLPVAGAEMLETKDPEMFAQAMKSAAQSLAAPIADPLHFWTPAIIRPFVELATGTSLLTGRPIESPYEQENRLPVDIKTRYTTETSQAIAKAFEDVFQAFGLHSFLSPKEIEQFASSATGGMALDAMRTVDLVRGVGRPFEMRDVPGVGALNLRSPEIYARQVQRFYDTLAELERVHGSSELAKKEGKEPTEPEGLKGELALLRRYEARIRKWKERRESGKIEESEFEAERTRLATEAMERLTERRK